MSQMFTFHKSVRGQGHILRDLPCEDSSASYTSEDGRYHIAIIADGHGQRKSFRSKFGSQTAADVALECLKGFADVTLGTAEGEARFYQDILTNPRYRQMTLRQVTNTILANWSDRIFEDYYTNPPSEEELGEYAEYFQEQAHIPQIYGTTLIAALKLPGCLILVQQGDGRCVVFYTDGSVDQPIPWDSRCEGNVTTSMCDEDATDSFRHCVIDTAQKPVAACYVGSDGVEDAYRSHEGTHTFYKDLTCELVNRSETDFDAYLDEMLPEFSAYGRFSKAGSMDDVSISGIVDLEAAGELAPNYGLEVHKFCLSEDLFWKEDELRSKMRAHGILHKRMVEAQARFEQGKKYLRELERELQVTISQLGTLRERIQRTKQELQEDADGFNAFSNYFNFKVEPKDEEHRNILRMIQRNGPQALQEILYHLKCAFSSKEKQLGRLNKDHADLEKAIAAKENAIDEAKLNLENLQAQAELAVTAFEEFDVKYRAIADEIERIKEQIANPPCIPS